MLRYLSIDLLYRLPRVILRFGQARKILVLTCNALFSNEDSGESPESAYNIVRVYEDSGN